MSAADPISRLRASEELFARFGILAAYAFGSRVSGRPLPDSDLDVGYYLAADPHRAVLPLDEDLRLQDELTRRAGCQVDLLALAQAPLELRGRALVDGVRLYSGDDVARVGLERDLLGRYHDYREVFERMHRERLARIAEEGL